MARVFDGQGHRPAFLGRVGDEGDSAVAHDEAVEYLVQRPDLGAGLQRAGQHGAGRGGEGEDHGVAQAARITWVGSGGQALHQARVLGEVGLRLIAELVKGGRDQG